MRTCTVGLRAESGAGRLHSPALTLVSRPALLHVLTVHDVAALRAALARGRLPSDLLEKLRKLAGGDLSHRFIEQNCRLFAALLLATEAGDFRVSPAERERLERVLAYVRKDDDVIPDYTPEGFTDDQQEVRAAMVELGGLLKAFKAWRLRYQVPGLWFEAGVRTS